MFKKPLLLIALFAMLPATAHAANTPFYTLLNTSTDAGALGGTELFGVTKGGSQTFSTSPNSLKTFMAANLKLADNASFVIPGTLAVANDQTSNWFVCTRASTFVAVYAQVKTAPTGAAVIFDIDKSTNFGSTFTSIWNSTPANRIQIAAAAFHGSQTSFDTTTCAAGDILRIDIAQVGSTIAGANASVRMALSVTGP